RVAQVRPWQDQSSGPGIREAGRQRSRRRRPARQYVRVRLVAARARAPRPRPLPRAGRGWRRAGERQLKPFAQAGTMSWPEGVDERAAAIVALPRNEWHEALAGEGRAVEQRVSELGAELIRAETRRVLNDLPSPRTRAEFEELIAQAPAWMQARVRDRA